MQTQEDLEANKKRKEARLLVDIPAEYRLEKSQNYVVCRLINISGAGIGVEIKSFLAEGDELKLKFSIGGKNIEIDCTVVQILGKIIGLQYKDVQGKDVGFLRDYVQKSFFDRVRK